MLRYLLKDPSLWYPCYRRPPLLPQPVSAKVTSTDDKFPGGVTVALNFLLHRPSIASTAFKITLFKTYSRPNRCPRTRTSCKGTFRTTFTFEDKHLSKPVQAVMKKGTDLNVLQHSIPLSDSAYPRLSGGAEPGFRKGLFS